MKASTLITWGLIVAVIWELDKQRGCACGTDGTGGACDSASVNVPTGSVPDWIAALGGSQSQ